ncbi:MAG: Gfo/Idh/MocA family protein [Ruthenibacterium lactatiformans]
MLDREALDAVFIGTRCGLHARYAALVMERGLPLFLEKPVCIDEAQYARLLAAPPAQRGRVMVSFPLHVTCIVQEMKRLVDSGALGDVVSVQAVNNVPYGGVYYHSWYRDAALTGGLFLQKSTHDIDYITHILGKRPVSVAALTSKMYFKGNKPAGLHCPDCPEYRTCPESSFVVEHRRKEEPSGELCCFARDTGNEDVGAALFTCEDGTLISYHQTFLVKNDAGRRGARFIGTRASAEFDFYTAQLRVDYYDERHTAVHQFHYPEGLVHFGGDEALARGFAEMLEGAPSPLGLEHGLASAAACLAARRAAQTHREETIEYGF